MNHGEGLHHGADLVALQASNEMPINVEIHQILLFRESLLQPTFTEGPLTKLSQGTNRTGWMTFADGKKSG